MTLRLRWKPIVPGSTTLAAEHGPTSLVAYQLGQSGVYESNVRSKGGGMPAFSWGHGSIEEAQAAAESMAGVSADIDVEATLAALVAAVEADDDEEAERLARLLPNGGA